MNIVFEVVWLMLLCSVIGALLAYSARLPGSVNKLIITGAAIQRNHHRFAKVGAPAFLNLFRPDRGCDTASCDIHLDRLMTLFNGQHKLYYLGNYKLSRYHPCAMIVDTWMAVAGLQLDHTSLIFDRMAASTRDFCLSDSSK